MTKKETLDPKKLPTHVAMIMDGNGRWAKQRLMNRVKGHEKGANAVREVVRVTRELSIPYLTLYAFSTENWARPKAEVAALMMLLKKFIRSEKGDMMKNNIRLNAIGQLSRLPKDVYGPLTELMAATEKNTGLCLTLALSYGSRDELVSMTRTIAEKVKKGEIDPDDVSEELISEHLYTAGIPDPDLMIRTSGEMRISNFLMWQLSYAEICFTNTFWPDFGEEEYKGLLLDYQNRERRFGKVLSE